MEREREQDGEARRCRITAGIVKSRHGEEEEEKAAAGVEVYKNIGYERPGATDKVKSRKDRRDIASQAAEAEEGRGRKIRRRKRRSY